MSKQKSFDLASLFPLADILKLTNNANNQFLLNRPIFGSAVEMTALPADTSREEMDTAADSSRRLS